MNAAAYFLERARPNRIAIVTETSQHTYAELLEHVAGTSRALLELGVAHGDRVGLLGDNSLEWIAAYLAVLAIGAVAVPFPTTTRPAQLLELARAAGCRAFFMQPKYRARHAGVAAAFVDPARAHKWPSFTELASPDDLAALMFTSGSTGAPRAVMVSHRNLVANTADIVGYLELDEHDRIMVVLPFSYCFGASLLHTHLRAGGSLVLDNRFAFPAAVLDNLQRTACTGLAGVPSTFQILLRNANLAGRAQKLPALRKIQQAGGRLPDVFIDELRAALPDARIFIMYGQTEATARLSYLPPDELATHRGSIGRGLPSTRLSVLRPDGSPVTADDHEVGEIVARGDNVTLGYFGDPDETARVFRDGALWTGDLARVDADGYITIVDRARDFIKASGHRVSSKEIEDHLVALPDVVEAAVVGVPDDLLGEAVLAFVVLRSAATISRDELLAHCRRVMPAHMVPRELVLVATLPRGASGKVAKSELKTCR